MRNSKKTQDSDPEHVFLVTGHEGEICDMKYCIVVSHLATSKRTSQITSLSYSVSNHKYKKMGESPDGEYLEVRSHRHGEIVIICRAEYHINYGKQKLM